MNYLNKYMLRIHLSSTYWYTIMYNTSSYTCRYFISNVFIDQIVMYVNDLGRNVIVKIVYMHE